MRKRLVWFAVPLLVVGLALAAAVRGDLPAAQLHGSNACLFSWEGWVRQLSGPYRVIEKAPVHAAAEVHSFLGGG